MSLPSTPILARLIAALLLTAGVARAQEIGSNFNHVPNDIDFDYLKKAGVDWIRTTPYILDYLDENCDIEHDPGLAKVIKAGELGYKVAFGFRWDFRKREMRIPAPGSAEEKRLFDFALRILAHVGPHVDIFKLGNEPIFETMRVDCRPNDDGKIPLVVFTQRLLEEAVLPFYAKHPEWKRPDIYVGSMVKLYDQKLRNIPAAISLMKLAHEHPQITGLAMHAHVNSEAAIEESFHFARRYVPKKPIIVPEFSLQPLYHNKLDEPLDATPAGEAFAKKYHRDPKWKMYQWFNYANRNQVAAQEWCDLLESRPWWPRNYLLKYYAVFEKYGVTLATYPLRFTQHPPGKLNPKWPCWFLNPIYFQAPMVDAKGEPVETNPLCFDDYQTILKKGQRKAHENDS